MLPLFKAFCATFGTLVYLSDKPHFSEISPSGSQPEIISTAALPPGASDQYDAVVWSVLSCRPQNAARLSFSCQARQSS